MPGWPGVAALSGGRKVAPQIQRMKSEDLIASVFPDQIACLENLVGEREFLTIRWWNKPSTTACTKPWTAKAGWPVAAHGARRSAPDQPRPAGALAMAAEILNARPYTFLDDAPLEERRTQAVLNRRWSDPQSTDDLGALDAEAIAAAVREEAWPAPNGIDEMHEALMSLACITEAEARANPNWLDWLNTLADSGRACRASTRRCGWHGNADLSADDLPTG
jgi:ATP-dependent Lhr-like helicase